MSISIPGSATIPTPGGGGPFGVLMSNVESERDASAPEGTKWADVILYRDYDRGHQHNILSADQQRVLMGVLGRRHADNAVHKVVFEHANRVILESWTVMDETVQKYLAELWVKCSLPDFSADRNYGAIRDGNHAVGLGWNEQQSRVIMVGERWWDGKKGVYFAYDGNGQVAYAIKEWKDKEVSRRTLYYDDRIERYANRSGSWEQFMLPEDASWPVKWVKRDGSPLHIPLVHLSNVSDADTPYGGSILGGGVLGLQDEINDIQRDITVAARWTAYQMYWATGVAAETDASGDPIKTLVGPGMFLENSSPDAKYGVIQAGDMSQLIATHQLKVKTLGNNTATPTHLITGGDWPSGDALAQADKPLADSAQRVVDSVQPSWATIAHRSTEITNAFSAGAPLNEAALITANFSSPGKLDELITQQVEREKINGLLAMKTLGFSTKYLLVKFGLSETEADKIMADKLKETTDLTNATLPVGGPL